MDLTQFPDHFHETFEYIVKTLETLHRDHHEVFVEFLRCLIQKYGQLADACEPKGYTDRCVQTDGDDPQDVKVDQPQDTEVSPELQEQVWNLKSLAEDVRAVAQETLNSNQSQTFVYDESSGTYYNHEQQCYYIPQHKLYYYVQNKAYYTYDEENHCMKYYSSSDDNLQNQAEAVTTDDTAESSKTNNTNRIHGQSPKRPTDDVKPTKPPRPKDEDIEEGEIVDSDEEEEEEGEIKDESIDGEDHANEEPLAISATPSVIIASPTRIDLNIEPPDHCAPCVRITVRDSKIKGLDVGQLFIITRSGGTLGRDGQHDILLPDTNVSKEHLKFHYKYSEGMDVYEIVDCSRNGTALDGVNVEHHKPYRLGHGSVLKVGSTTLLCHIHHGTDTCAECEPSCLGFMNPTSPPAPLPSSGSLRTRHAAEMTQIKRKFGLNGGLVMPRLPKGYEDKSKIRRETVGSSHDSEKTDAGSTEEPIRSDNKGYAMLSKMGWKKGEGVGKSGEGTKSPVNVTVKMSKRGLGCPEDVAPLPKPKTKLKALEITKKRYEQCEQ